MFGIAECACRSAAEKHGRFGIVSILEGSLPRHRGYLEDLGLVESLAGDRPLGLGVTALGQNAESTFARLAEVAAELRDEDGAAAIVLGCTGMAPHRARLEGELGVPVIDPVQAAVEVAIAATGPAG